MPLQVVRYYATKHLRVLMRAGVASFSSWGMLLLVKQVRRRRIYGVIDCVLCVCVCVTHRSSTTRIPKWQPWRWPLWTRYKWTPPLLTVCDISILLFACLSLRALTMRCRPVTMRNASRHSSRSGRTSSRWGNRCIIYVTAISLSFSFHTTSIILTMTDATQGRDVMLRFLSSPNGFKFLSEISFIQNELIVWRKQEWILFLLLSTLCLVLLDAVPVPLRLALFLLDSHRHLVRLGGREGTFGRLQSDGLAFQVRPDEVRCGAQSVHGTANHSLCCDNSHAPLSDTIVHLPPHLYGELVKTPAGCALFQESMYCLSAPTATAAVVPIATPTPTLIPTLTLTLTSTPTPTSSHTHTYTRCHSSLVPHIPAQAPGRVPEHHPAARREADREARRAVGPRPPRHHLQRPSLPPRGTSTLPQRRSRSTAELSG